jgi:hypothetical protein
MPLWGVVEVIYNRTSMWSTVAGAKHGGPDEAL